MEDNRAEQRHSLRFWAIVFGLGCVSLFVVMWAASKALATKGDEKFLRIGTLFPKLKGLGDRKADASRMSEPKESAHPKDRKTVAPPHPEGAKEIAAVFDQPKVTITEAPPSPPVSTPEPPRYELNPRPELTYVMPSVELKPIPSYACTDPAVYLKPCGPVRGDTPMMRNWKVLAMYSLLTTASVVYVPQPIVAGEKKDAPIKVDGIDELKKSIDELVKRVAALENKKLTTEEEALNSIFSKVLDKELGKLGIGELSKDVAYLKTQLTRQQAKLDELDKKILAAANGSGTPAVDKAFMDDVKTSLKLLNDAVKATNETIAKMTPNEKRTAAYPPNGAPKEGRLVVVNLYNDDLLFVINGSSVRVPAGRTMTTNVPVGTLRYEVLADRWGMVDSRTVTLAAGETFTLTATQPR